MMKMVKLSDNLTVAPQITVENVAEIAASGYRVLVNNRPDGEEGDQPSDVDIANAAERAGLEYHYMPVTAVDFPGPDYEDLLDLLDDPSRPVFAFCRTGTRCTNLWVASRQVSERDEAVATAQQKGFDLGLVSAYLARGQ